MDICNKKIIPVIGLLICVEVLSFLTFVIPQASPYIFGLVALGIIYTTIRKLEWGVAIVFAELIVGSLGKMFVLPVGEFDLSIRMVIWVVVLGVWAYHVIQQKNIAFTASKLFKPFLIFAGIIIWGIAWALIRGVGLGALFADVNNYLYFALIFPVYEVFAKNKNNLHTIKRILLAGVTWLSVKTIILFYIFSHELFALQDVLYDWSRATRLAEITNVDPNLILSRVFMQSHIWLVFGFFVLIALIYREMKERSHTKKMTALIALAIGMLSAIIMSFSRSFWLALIAALIPLLVLLFFVLKEPFKKILSYVAVLVGIGVLSVGLTIGVMKFPFPPSNADSSFIKDRASAFSGEAAVSSRYAQIRPLMEGVRAHPVLGSGFGTTITYQSQDPRVLEQNPDGFYTTSAFELGWLEIWLKLGLLGVVGYLYILMRITIQGWKHLRQHNYIMLGSIIGLVALVLTHGVSPYLNHPLGIGIVILAACIFDTTRKED